MRHPLAAAVFIVLALAAAGALLAGGAHAQPAGFSPDTLDSLSAAALEAGDLERARDHAVRAAELRDAAAAGPDADTAIGWHEAGLAYYRTEDFENAHAAIGRAMAIWIALPGADPADVIWAQSDLAEMCRLTGRWAEAERALEEAIGRARAAGDPGGFLPVLLNNLGTLLGDQDRLAEAEPRLRESLELRAVDPETPPLALARGHQNLGVVLRSQRRWEDAERELRAALAIAREHPGPERRDVVPYLNGLAGLLARTGEPDAALVLRDESLAILEESVRPSRALLADILEESGRDLLAAGTASEARERFTRSAAIRGELFGEDSPEVGTARLGSARADALAHGPGDPRVGPGTDAALACLSTSPLYAEQRVLALALRARHRRARGDGEGAVPDLRAAVALMDTLRAERGGLDETRLLYAEEHRRDTDDLVQWLVEDGHILGPDGALSETERLRGRLLAEQLAAARLDIGRDLPEDLRRRLEDQETTALVLVNETRRRLRIVSAADLDDEDRARRIASLDSVLVAAVLELREARERRKLHSPRWAQMLRGLEGAGEAVEMAPGEAVLLYHVGYRESFVFWTGPDGRADFRAASLRGADGGAITADALRDEWEQTGQELRRMRGPARGVTGTTRIGEPWDPGGSLAALGGALLPPAALAALAGADRVSILPDGVLHAVPFEALRVPGEAGEEAWALDVLPPVRYAASLRALHAGPDRDSGGSGERRDAGQTPGPASGPARVLVVADPRTASLPPLPGARREADAVAAAFPPARVTRLEGADATEEAVRAELPRAGLVHIAAHGLADRGPGGLLAALVLAPPEEESGAGSGTSVETGPTGTAGTAGAAGSDGYLHLFEVYGLDLTCDLAWLSACDTNAGPIQAGEGAFALSRGFLVAGAGSVIASLWPLHDESAPAMVSAYLQAPPGNPAARLRAAKQAVRGRWPAPHHWAPFVLLGQGPGGE